MYKSGKTENDRIVIEMNAFPPHPKYDEETSLLNQMIVKNENSIIAVYS